METENRWPKVGHIIVDEVDGKPHFYIEYEYEEETPPTVEASAADESERGESGWR